MIIKNSFFIFFLFGLIFIIIIPPFQVPDEPNHFYRAYQVSEGQLIAQKKGQITGGVIPVSLVKAVNDLNGGVRFHSNVKQDVQLVFQAFSDLLLKDDVEFVAFPNTAILAPIAYFPQAVGLMVGKLFNLSPVALLYLGRLFNLLFYIFIIAITIKTVPIFKNIIFLLAFLPMSIHLAASVSADAATISVSFFVTALILNIAINPDANLSKKNIFLLFVFSFLLSFCKSTYFVLVFLFFIIPQSKAHSRVGYYLTAFLLVGVSTAATFFWGGIVETIYTPMLTDGNLFPTIAAAKSFIFLYPLQYIIIIINSIAHYLPITIEGFIGILGWLDTHLPLFLIIIYFLVLLGAAIIDSDKKMYLRLQQKMIISLVAFIGCLLVITSQFFIWTSMGSLIIGGFQGRYLIPFGPLFFLLFHSSAFSVKNYSRIASIYFVSFSIFSLVVTLYTVTVRFYVR